MVKVVTTYSDDSLDVLDKKFLLSDEEEGKSKPEYDFDALWEEAIHHPEKNEKVWMAAELQVA